MNEPQKAVRKPRAWLRWMRWFGAAFALLLISLTLLGFYLYHNLTGVVVWFANRSHPRLLLELQHAGFTGSHRIELQNVALKPDGGHDPVLLIEKAVIDFNWSDLRNHRIGSIQVENPRVSANDALLNMPAQQTVEKTPIASAEGLWRVDEFKVTGGAAEINVSHSPVVRFGFVSDMREIYLSSETRFSTQSQTLNISGIEFLSRDAKPVKFGTIKSVTVSFSLDRLAQNKIDELTISTPSLWLTPKLLETFGARNSVGVSAAAGNPGVVAGPPAPWVAGKLHLTDGELFVKGFGNNVPEASMKFAIDEQDLQLGASADALSGKLHKIETWDIRCAAPFARFQPFLRVDSTEIVFTAGGLFQRGELEAVTITGMDFQMGQTFRSLLAAAGQEGGAATAPSPPAANDSKPWTIRNLHVFNSRATIAELGPELPDIGFKLDTDMSDVALSGEIRHASTKIQEVVISDLTVPSPRDPFVPVLNFATIRLRFSLAQILDEQIDQVILEKPTIFVGQQLFWYFDELKQRQSAAQSAAPLAAKSPAPKSNWTINKLNVMEGNLVVANAGQAGVTMPFEFSTEAENLHSDLSDLQLKMKLVIAKGNYLFPTYQLEFKQLWGSIDFGLPPGTDARNVVQTLQAAGAKWKQFDASQLWFFVTYDAQGIYGKFGGAAYHGYIDGGFDFYMMPDTPWAGWVSGSKLDLAQITGILAPQNFQMSGPADFDVEVNGLNHEIQRLAGSLKTGSGGKLKIGKLDQMISAIPASWSSIKQGSTRIMLETLRDFDYTDGNADFWYVGNMGHLTLKVRGPHGSRNFDIALHGD